MSGVYFKMFSPSMLLKKNLPKFSTPCEFCRVVATGRKKCGRCQLVYYCNSDCQAAHWSAHKARCQLTTADPGLESRNKMRSTFKRLMASQYSTCITVAAGRPGVFILALSLEITHAIVFRFCTRLELRDKKGPLWNHVIDSLGTYDPCRCVIGALEDPDGDLVGTVTVEQH